MRLRTSGKPGLPTSWLASLIAFNQTLFSLVASLTKMNIHFSCWIPTENLEGAHMKLWPPWLVCSEAVSQSHNLSVQRVVSETFRGKHRSSGCCLMRLANAIRQNYTYVEELSKTRKLISLRSLRCLIWLIKRNFFLIYCNSSLSGSESKSCFRFYKHVLKEQYPLINSWSGIQRHHW